ncbi:MAG TPA: thioesterase family protein [Thermoanaerobaculia bacterium]|nr:thioesterase family protein [Thermoanaerobaculia bacterium]
MPFERMLYARWGDMDFNGHMKNTAYLDASADVRMMFFSDHGFSMREFERRGLGPVILRDELEYFRELRLLDPVRVTLAAAGLNEDGSRFRLRNEFFRADGERAARVTSSGGWLDLAKRRLTPPPEDLRALLTQLERTADYEALR